MRLYVFNRLKAAASKLVASYHWWTRTLNDETRATLSLSIGGGLFFLGLGYHWPWEISFLSAWIVSLFAYLMLYASVIFASGPDQARERLSKMDPSAISLLVAVVLVVLLGVAGLGVVLTSVGQRPTLETRFLIGLSTIGVILSWMLLHSSFAGHYAKLYFSQDEGNEAPLGGFIFPGCEAPAYEDFLYLSFTIGLTFAMSDVSVTKRSIRRVVLFHSMISFFFYSTVVAAVLNSVVTS